MRIRVVPWVSTMLALAGCNGQNAALVDPTFAPTGETGNVTPPDAGGGPSNPGQSGLPCDVQALLAARCQSCHSSPPSGGALMPMVTWADLAAPAKTQPKKSVAQLSLERMQNASAPMPPAPATGPAASELAAFSAWVQSGLPKGSCTPPDGGVLNPYNTPVTCSTGQTWFGGEGSSQMDPGQACINCHQSRGGEAPSFSIAGTAYKTAHEPDNCYGQSAGSAGAASVVITDSANQTVTLQLLGDGNFYYPPRRGGSVTLVPPYRAKVVSGGLERAMVATQQSGDCNSCHTEPGASNAPGRIMLP